MNLKWLLLCFFMGLLIVPAQSRRFKKRFKRDAVDVVDDQSGDHSGDNHIDTDWDFKLHEPDGQCNPNPCLNNGVCQEKGNRRFKCDCPEPFKGKLCQKVVDDQSSEDDDADAEEPEGQCNPNPCLNNGVCQEKGNRRFKCDCPEPFKGKLCQKVVDDQSSEDDDADAEEPEGQCNPNPCLNNGVCQEKGNRRFKCDCPEPFTGMLCQKVVDDQSSEDADADADDDDEDVDTDWVFNLQEPEGQCNPNPCLNNGVCQEKGNRRFKCDCPEPFKGKLCQKGPKPCKRGTCGNGDCVLTTTAPFYECKCKEPFQPPNCITAADVCQNNPCRNGGTCVDGKVFSCECPLGFTGRYCHVGPNDCYQDDGENYHGNVSETEEEFQCLHWNSYFILKKGTDPFTAYEDADGLGPHNFCRNPDGERKPWCFLRRGRKLQWGYCDVKKCPTAATSTVPPPPPPSPEPTTTKPSESPKPPGVPVQSTTESSSHLRFSTCGKPQPKKVIDRIYGGLKSIPGAQPWQLSLQIKFKDYNQPYIHICGATLIDSCWALTAAHCIYTRYDIQVVAGGLSLNSDEPTEQAIEVERAIVHENYQLNGAPTNDIALLKLKGTNGICAKETQFVKAACLPDTPLPDGKKCTISGWGATENADSSDHLLDAEVLLISQQTCTSPTVYGNIVDDSMVCAGYLQGVVDSCQGDSGGPLTCENQGTHVVYGLVSWGDSCAKKNRPGVYTRVIHFLDWIKSKKATA